MSLSPKGLLRWYASCCNTPIGNTPRNAGMAYVGLAHNCLSGGGSPDAAFGPVRMRSGAASARGEAPPAPRGSFFTLAGFAGKLLRARLNGSYRRNPFFKGADLRPVVAPTVLSKEERARLTPA
jgi:hypothetical protein